MRLPAVLLVVTALLTVSCAAPPQPRPIAENPSSVPAIAILSPVSTTSVPPATTPTATMGVPIAAIPTLPPSASGNLLRINMKPIDAVLPSSFHAPAEAGFASFQLPTIEVQAKEPNVAPAADLSNVQIPVLLSPAQRKLLAQNGFVVSPGAAHEFYEVYEQARYNYQPALITSDAVLHLYHLAFDNILRRLEQRNLSKMLARMDWELAYTSLQYAEVLANTPYAEAARRNAAYFAIPVAILYPDWTPPANIQDLVKADVTQIAAHNNRGVSAIFPGNQEGQDWTQYTPRGHYTLNADLTRYFQAMMWHGLTSFSSSPGDAVNEAIVQQQQLLLTHALRYTMVGDVPAATVWQGIYDATAFFVGESRSLSPVDMFAPLKQAYGDVGDVRQLVDDTRLSQFYALAPADNTGAARAFRFMGQRIVPDTNVFKRLVDPEVAGRLTPKALDFFAVLGSDRALDILTKQGDTDYPKYSDLIAELRATFAKLDIKDWTRTLYWSWIYTLRPLLDKPSAGYPAFMQSPAWRDKQLTTVLGSWTELKHDTILYAEQVVAEGAGGSLQPPSPVPPKGYVEPVPALYARINALVDQTHAGLERRGLLDDGATYLLGELGTIAKRLQAMSETQLRGVALSEDDYAYIRTFGKTLETLTFIASTDSGTPADVYTGDKPVAAIIADIGTNKSGSVIYQATGYVADIYAIVPIEGNLVVAHGGTFTHYEFQRKLGSRLTDEIWREELAAGKAPPRAVWSDSFVVEDRVEAPVEQTILAFNDKIVAAFFYGTPSDIASFLTGTERDDTLAFITNLNQHNQAIGMQRQSINFLSFDFASASHATVTTRERWKEDLYGSAVDPTSFDLPAVIGRRAYEVTSTYTLERQGDHWLISKVVLAPEPPAWGTP
jgi:hypothetical protein